MLTVTPETKLRTANDSYHKHELFISVIVKAITIRWILEMMRLKLYARPVLRIVAESERKTI